MSRSGWRCRLVGWWQYRPQRSTEYVQWAVVGVALATFVPSLLLALLIVNIPMGQVEDWALGCALIGVGLFLATGWSAYFAIRDFRRAHNSSQPGVYSVSQRLLLEAALRLGVKACLAAALITFWGNRHWHGLMHFFQRHPVALILLVLEAAILLTLTNLFTVIWDHEFDKEQRRDATS